MKRVTTLQVILLNCVLFFTTNLLTTLIDIIISNKEADAVHVILKTIPNYYILTYRIDSDTFVRSATCMLHNIIFIIGINNNNNNIKAGNLAPHPVQARTEGAGFWRTDDVSSNSIILFYNDLLFQSIIHSHLFLCFVFYLPFLFFSLIIVC